MGGKDSLHITSEYNNNIPEKIIPSTRINSKHIGGQSHIFFGDYVEALPISK